MLWTAKKYPETLRISIKENGVKLLKNCLPGIRAKFFQNPGLMAALLNTGDRKLVESSYDDLWGTGIPLSDPSALDETQWKFIGLLGKMLMVIRSEKNCHY